MPSPAYVFKSSARTRLSIVTGPSPSALHSRARAKRQLSSQRHWNFSANQWYREAGQPIVALDWARTAQCWMIPTRRSCQCSVYRVRVSNSLGSIISDPVTPDCEWRSQRPRLWFQRWPTRRNQFSYRFSEPLDTARACRPMRSRSTFTAGAGNLAISRAVFTERPTCSFPLLLRRSFRQLSVTITSGAVMDKSGNPVAAAEVPISAQLYLLSFSGTTWKYRADGVDLALRVSGSAFDDSTWPAGPSVFDGKTLSHPAHYGGGLTVATQLPLTNSAWPSTTTVIPTYYFRAHFSCDHARSRTSLKLRHIDRRF